MPDKGQLRRTSSRPLSLTVSALIAIAAAVLFGMMSVALIIGGTDRPFAYLGALGFAPASFGFAALIFSAVFRRNKTHLQLASILCWTMCGFVVFGCIANIGEAVQKGESGPMTFWLTFIAVCVLVAGFFAQFGLGLRHWHLEISDATPPQR